MREVHVDLEHVTAARGGQVYGVGGARLGTLTTVYLAEGTGRPEWIEVKLGPMKHRLVPLDHAQVVDERVDVPVDRRVVNKAPRIRAHHGVVRPVDEQRLVEHYDLRPSHHRAHALQEFPAG